MPKGSTNKEWEAPTQDFRSTAACVPALHVAHVWSVLVVHVTAEQPTMAVHAAEGEF